MRQMFKKRYTKEGVRAFYSKDENEVHLTYPDKLGSPFKSRRLVEDIVDDIRNQYGIYVTWTPYDRKGSSLDDTFRFVHWVEVVL